MLFLKGHESLGSRVTCFRCVTLRHFEGLKIRFLKCSETLGSRLSAYRWSILDIFMPWKCHSCRVVRPLDQGYKASSENFVVFWRPENAITQVSWDPRPSTHPQSLCSVFWWPENEIFQGSWDSWLNNILLPLRNFSSFWRPKKSIPAASLNHPH
jgi:hypothetical protein